MSKMKSLFVGALMALVASASVHAETGGQDTALDLELLTRWFEGEFDNSDQLWFEADPRSSTPEEARHQRLHTIHMRIDLPEFGERVFYVEEYGDNDPANVFRQRIVIFSPSDRVRTIRMRQGFFKDTQKVLGGKNLEGLTQDDVFFLDECDVFWKRDAGQFVGKMDPKACVFGEGETRRYSVHNMSLSQNRYWRVDSTFLVSDDSRHSGEPVDSPFEMKRAVRYECEISFRDEGHPPQKITGLSLHSEGGTAIVKRDSDGQEFELLLRAKEYPFFDHQPDFLYFSVRKKGENRSVSFAVSDLHSRRVGFNNGNIVPHCARVGYTFRESWDVLDNK